MTTQCLFPMYIFQYLKSRFIVTHLSPAHFCVTFKRARIWALMGLKRGSSVKNFVLLYTTVVI